MNIGRHILLILTGWLCISFGLVAGETRLPDSVFEDWSAVVSESTLPDGSVLFDYSARTFSGRTEGAMLAISFVPRFHCAPTINVRTRADSAPAATSVILEIAIDSESMQFDGLYDEAGEYLLYAIAESSDVQDQLRKKIDVASRISFKIVTSDAEGLASSSYISGADEVGSIVFSLLGSRLAALSAEEHCKAHEPLAYTPQ